VSANGLERGVAGMIEGIVGPERIAKMSYFIKEVPEIDWQWMFVIGHEDDPLRSHHRNPFRFFASEGRGHSL